MAIRVVELYEYPVKSCEGKRVKSAHVNASGFGNDRRFVIVDERGIFQQQRVLPQLALIRAALRTQEGARVLTLSARGAVPITLAHGATQRNRERVTVQIFKDTCTGFDCGDDVAEWLHEVLGKPYRLIERDTKARVSPSAYPDVREAVAFQDAYPVLGISRESLQAFNAALREQHPDAPPKTMANFRPNVVFDGCPAFDEDVWDVIDVIGRNHPRMQLEGVKRCDRCTIPDVDPRTGERTGTNTRKLLQAMGRNLPMYPKGMGRDDVGPCFGMNFGWIFMVNGFEIEEGDEIRVVSRWS